MSQDQVLRVGRAYFTEAVAVGQVGNLVHLVCVYIPRSLAVILQRQVDDAVTRVLVDLGIAPIPAGKPRVDRQQQRQVRIIAEFAVAVITKRPRNRGDARIVELQVTVAKQLPFGFNLLSKGIDTDCIDENLDSRLVKIVATAVQVVHA